jgi:hypothetical protein
MLPSDTYRSLGLGRVGAEGTAGPSPRRRETAYVRYPGCRHGHVTDPQRPGYADSATADDLPSPHSPFRGWGGGVRSGSSPRSRSGQNDLLHTFPPIGGAGSLAPSSAATRQDVPEYEGDDDDRCRDGDDGDGGGS